MVLESPPIRISDDVVPRTIYKLSDHAENLRQPAVFGVAFGAPRAKLSGELGVSRLCRAETRHCIVFGSHEEPPYGNDDVIQRHPVRLLSSSKANDQAAQIVERVERCSQCSFERL
jgi:hypothetical protein